MSQISVTELSKELRNAITKLETSGNLDEVGIVLRIGDGAECLFIFVQVSKCRPR
jgi:hypothetical protein